MTILQPTPCPPDGGGGDTNAVHVTRTTGMALGGHRVVTSDDDGKLVYADKGMFSDVTRAFWLTTSAWGVGELADVIAFGMVEEFSWTWTPGELIFLNSNGLMTQIPPTELDGEFLVVVAKAVTDVEIFFDPSPPIAFA